MKIHLAVTALLITVFLISACSAVPTAPPTVPATATASATTNPADALITPKLVQDCLLQPSDWDVPMQLREGSSVAWVEASMPTELKRLGIAYVVKCIIETPSKSPAVLLNVFLFQDIDTATQKFSGVSELYNSLGQTTLQAVDGFGEQGIEGKIHSGSAKKNFYVWRVKNAILLLRVDDAAPTWDTNYMRGIANKLNQRLAQ